MANAEEKEVRDNEPLEVDCLVVTHETVDMGQPLKSFTAAAQGRATPIRKPTSHVEIRVAGKENN